MNATTQTFLRSILKIGGGYVVAKGVADEGTMEVISGGAVALIGVIWGYFHRAAPVPSSEFRIPISDRNSEPGTTIFAA